MEAKDILRQAMQAVNEAEVPEDLRSVAFNKAVDMILGFAGSTSSPPGIKENDTTGAAQTDGPMSKIAEKLKIKTATLEGIYHLENDEIELMVDHSKLAKAKRNGTQQIALLVAAGRQASGIDDEFTDINKIREVCDEFGKYDSANFMATLKAMGEEFMLRKKKSVKLRQFGWSKAKELIEGLYGNSV